MSQTNHEKTIKLFFIDADSEGKMVCELLNWTGKVNRIPREKVKNCDMGEAANIYLSSEESKELIMQSCIRKATTMRSPCASIVVASSDFPISTGGGQRVINGSLFRIVQRVHHSENNASQ